MGTLVKTVEMRVLAKAGDAQRQMDELAAKGDALDAKEIRMRFRLDGGAEGKAQLDDIRAKADLLGFKDATVKVKVDGAGRAIADLMAVRREEDKAAGDVHIGVSGGGGIGGLLGRLLGGGASAAGGAGGAAPAIGGIPLPALAAILAGAAAAAAPLLVEVTALASGAAAAGAGLGAFGIIAKSVYTSTAAAAAKVKTAQDNYNIAIANGVKPAQAYKTEQIAIAKAYADLTPAQIALSRAIGAAADSWQSFVAKNTGGVAQIMTKGIGLLPGIFASLQPFLKPTEDALSGILDKLGKAISPPKALLPGDPFKKLTAPAPPETGWQKFIDSLSKISGPAITAIGTGIGGVAAAMGRLLTVMSGKDVAHAINIVFGGITGTINAVTTSVGFLMRTWDGMGIAIHNVADNFDRLRHSFASDFLHQPAHDFDTLRHSVAGLGHDVATTFDGIRHSIASDFLHQPAHDFDTLRHSAAGAAHDIAHAFDNVRHAIASKFDGIKGDITSKFAGAAAWLSGVPHDIASAFDHVRHAIASKFDGIKGDITSKFAGAAGWLVSAGAAIIRGLISGIESMAGAVAGAIGHIVGTIWSHIPHSPAKEGPLSGAGSPEISGMRIAEMLARGMDAGRPGVAQAAGRLAGAAAGTAGMAGARGYGGGDVHLHFEAMVHTQDSVRQAVQALREYKRHGGGAALGIA